ncbi:MAG TPA: chloride channel protein [Bacteroidales bacterium]|nr:chloride channel protein [Bacteroidales bacterium]HKM13148.1 chloride channel protein [Bacteroidales bacterium]HPB89498.1 chloride channel protein [Bacteroidales bacterium]HQA92676.1 chloride channel protein [Bacteroidales bacterium]HQN24261.1 chloride channel protein [Bacteroidales bacterium]
MKIFSRIKKGFSAIPERTQLVLLSFVVGLGCGFAAVLLKTLIKWIHHGLTFWFTKPSDAYLYLIYPGIGMLLSFLFVRYFVKDDISHGVTKVLLSISRNESRIKPHNTWTSIMASSVTIGFGGSVGAEAPIVYTGAAIGSNVGRSMGMSYKNMTILLGCGAAGAVAGIFKAPLAGVLFTLEILLFNISMTSILPLLISAITATVVSYIFLGDAVAIANTIETFSMGNLPYYFILGIFCGIISLYFIRTSLRVEDKMRRISKPINRWIVGAISMGVLVFLFPPLYGEGYDSLTLMLNNNPIEMAGGIIGERVLANKWAILLFFTAILLVKVYATAFTNAGGGVGGTFGPTLFTGGIAGFVLGRFINLTGIHVIPEANFVLVGMGGLMAGVMQAPMTAIFLIAEMTGGYDLLIPLILTSAISFATIRLVEQYSIYTKRIAQQGDLLTHDSDRAVLTLLKTSDLIETDFSTIGFNSTLGDLVKVIATSKRNIFPVVDHYNQFQGIVFLDDVRKIMFDQSQYESVQIPTIMKNAPAIVYYDEKMDSVMNKFELTQAWNLPVVDRNNKYLGFVSKSKIFSSYREQLQQVSHD